MSDQRIQYNEEMVGAGHPTKSDTLNRLVLTEHNSDGTHKQKSRGYKSGLTPAYKDADELTFSGGVIEMGGVSYTLDAATDVTFSSLAASSSYWVYLAPPASGTTLAAAQFSASAAAPTRNHAKAGLYNAAGDKRAVFGFTTNGSGDIRKFTYAGHGEVFYETQITEASSITPGTTFTDVALSVPALKGVVAKLSIWHTRVSVYALAYIRTKGAASQHYGTPFGYTVTQPVGGRFDWPVDASAKIAVAVSSAGSNKISVYCHGFNLPEGM